MSKKVSAARVQESKVNTWPIKDPTEVLNYTFDFAKELATGEAIASYIITLSDGLVEDASSNTTSSVTVRLSGGNLGATGKVECQVTTDGGQIIIDAAYIPIQNK